MVAKLTPEARNAFFKDHPGWAEVEGRDAVKKSFAFDDFNEKVDYRVFSTEFDEEITDTHVKRDIFK